jgi:hypothetical protein
MGVAVEFRYRIGWELKKGDSGTYSHPELELGKTYSFQQPGQLIYLIGKPTDLVGVNENGVPTSENPIAKIKILETTHLINPEKSDDPNRPKSFIITRGKFCIEKLL